MTPFPYPKDLLLVAARQAYQRRRERKVMEL